MAVLETVIVTAAVTGLLLVTMTALIVSIPRFLTAIEGWRPRVRGIWPYVALIVVVSLLRTVSQRYTERLTWLLDFNLTTLIFAFEGDFIGIFQLAASPPVSAYFGFMYLYGYVTLTTFPIIAYFCLPSIDHLKEYLGAFLINNAVGLLFYALFISFGPRNLGVGFVDPILYQIYPQASILTGTVNIPINVFPSLHASMAVTVMLLAWRTRLFYPAWMVLAAIFGVSVVFATMYLGIHWATDVVGGIVLAVGSVYLAVRYVQGTPVIGSFTSQPPSGLDRFAE